RLSSAIAAAGLGSFARSRRSARESCIAQGANPCRTLLAGALVALSLGGVAAAAPTYNIIDLGIVHPSDVASQGFRISPNSDIAVGRSYASPFSQTSSSSQAFSWTQGGGIAGLPIYSTSNPTRNYDFANGVNNAGVVVGGGGNTASGA